MTHATHPLHAFLAPQSVAMIGVSPNWSYINSVLKQFLALKTPARIYPVNPNYPVIEGLTAYPRLTDIPDPVDLVIVSVPVRLVPEALAHCEAKRVKAVNIITSGFAELGGKEGARRHAHMTDFVQRTGIRIVGPNTYGNFSAVHQFAGMPFAQRAMTPGHVALAFHSGGMALYAMTALVDRYIGHSHVVCTGNEADIDIVDCLTYYAEDEATWVIGCFVEQIRRPEAFLRAAERCADLRKPIVMLKVGRSEAGRQTAQAHTGALAGADRVIHTVLKKYGVVRVHSLEEMIETLAVLHTRKLPTGDGVGAVTVSGGANGMLTDLAADIGVRLPPFSAASHQTLRRSLYDFVNITNPLDITGPAINSDLHVHQAALDAIGADPAMSIVLYGTTGSNGCLDAQGGAGKALLKAMRDYPDKVWLRMAVVSGTFREQPLNQPVPVEPITHLDGVPFLQGFENSLRAVASLIRYAEFQRGWAGKQADRETGRDGDRARPVRARQLLEAAGGRALTEAEGKALLALYGIPVTREQTVSTVAEAVVAAQAIGFPVAMKIVSPDILHKTEAGGVALDIQDVAGVGEAFERLLTNARRYRSDANIQGVSVQEMVVGGQEMMVGMVNDPQFGPAILVGLGGILVEVLNDTSVGLPPLGRDDVQAMLKALRGFALLQGVRGHPPADLDALIDCLLHFSDLCLELGDRVAEIDINPLVVLEQGRGVKALDCVIT